MSSISSRSYSKVVKASLNDESSQTHIFSSSPDRSALAQPGLLRGQSSKIFVKYTFYKGKAALGMQPKAPEYSTVDSGGIRLSKEGCVFLEFAPAVGTRQYDWSKKQIFALSVLELGTLLSLDPNEPCEFFHDPFVGKSEAGKIRKVLKVGMLQDTGGYFFNLRVSDRNLNIDESLFMPITKGEFSVMRSAFNFILPYLMGWHAYIDSTKLNESGHFTSGSPSIGKRPDLEWGDVPF
jgi:hypothetical protein